MEAPSQRKIQALTNAATAGVTGLISDGASSTGTQWGQQQRESTLYVDWTTGTSAGAVIVEHAHDSSYTGTWAPFGTFTWATANTLDSVQITGCVGAWRARITTTVVGGTGVNVYALSN